MKPVKEWRFGFAGVLLFVGCRFLTNNTLSAGIATICIGFTLYIIDRY